MTAGAKAVAKRPYFYSSETFSLRSILPPTYRVGARNFSELPPVGTAQQTGPVGLLEAITAAAGEVLNALGGLRLTRLTQPVSQGDTTIYVERSHGLPATGVVAIDGVPYQYSSENDGSLGGIGFTHGGVFVSGAANDHDIGSQVTDLSVTYSAIDQATHALFLDTATGTDLSVIGRNLGVLRAPSLADDEQYRNLIRVLAYNPRGTLLGLRLVLDTLVGAGNYAITEDLEAAPCEVSITVSGALFLNSVSQGKTYLQDVEYDVAKAGALTTSTADYFISAVQLPQDNFYLDLHATLPDAAAASPRPNTAAATQFVWMGQSGASQGQGVSVQPDIGGALSTATDFLEAPGLYHYSGGIAPTSVVRVAGRFAFGVEGSPSSTDGRQFGVLVADGARAIAWGVVQQPEQPMFSIGLIDASTGRFLDGQYETLNAKQFYDIELRKNVGTAMALVIDGVIVQTASYGEAAVTTAFGVDLGALLGITLTCHAQVMGLGLSHKNSTEYMNLQPGGSNTASLAGAGSNQLALASSAQASFTEADTGKTLRITGSTVKNSLGGNNNQTYVASFADARHINLSLPSGTTQLSSATPQRLVLSGPSDLLRYPDSLGTKITLGPSAQGNAGTYTITKLLHPQLLTDLSLAPMAKSQPTTVCEVQGASFVTEGSVAYQLQPQLTAESNVKFTLVDAAAHTANTDGTLSLTTRAPLPLPTASYALRGDTVRSAQVFDTHVPFVTIDANGTASAFPFYVSDAFSYVEQYLQGVVAAGVRLNFYFS